MRRPIMLVALGLLTPLLAVAPPAQAAPATEIEPNDTILQVTASANTEGLKGVLGASDDVDYFWIGLRPQRQVRIVATATGCNDEPYIEIDSIMTLRPYNDTPDSGTTTTPGIFGGPTQHFLVSVSQGYFGSSATCAYSLQVQSASGGTTDAIDPTPPQTFPVAPLAEPNDLAAQANGPLVGEVNHAGSIETTNDVDQVLFQVKAGSSVNVKLSVGAGDVDVESDSSTLSDLSVSGGSYEIASLPVSAVDRTYLMALSGDAGSTYQLLLTPASSLGTTAAPPPPPASESGPTASPKRIKPVLRTTTPYVKRGGIVTLKGQIKGIQKRVRVTILQRGVNGSRWIVEARKKTNRRAKFRHREDLTGGSRYYRVCFKSTCSKSVLVRRL